VCSFVDIKQLKFREVEAYFIDYYSIKVIKIIEEERRELSEIVQRIFTIIII